MTRMIERQGSREERDKENEEAHTGETKGNAGERE